MIYYINGNYIWFFRKLKVLERVCNWKELYSFLSECFWVSNNFFKFRFLSCKMVFIIRVIIK